MEKIEELIDGYKKQIEFNTKYIKGEWACEADRISGMKIAVDVLSKLVKDLEQLKQSLQQTKPAPVEVPEFVAEWYEENKHDLDYKIWVYIYDFDSQDQSEFSKWANNILNNSIETLIRMKDGYTVAKEPLYCIYDPIADQYLGYDRVEEKVWWLNRYSDGAAAELTYAEISKIGEQYRAFAVPVEEEEK